MSDLFINEQAEQQPLINEQSQAQKELNQFLDSDISVKKKGEQGYNSRQHSTSNALANINKIEDFFKDKELKLDDKTKRKLRVREQRYLAQGLLNSRRTFAWWDSQEMKAVKDSVAKVESMLYRKDIGDFQVGEGALYFLNEAYRESIDACKHYIEVKGTRLGSTRYKLVRQKLKSLMEEYEIFRAVEEKLKNKEDEEGPVVSTLADLLVLYPLQKEQYKPTDEEKNAQSENVNKEILPENIQPLDALISDPSAKAIYNILTGNFSNDFFADESKFERRMIGAIYDKLNSFSDGGECAVFHTAIYNYDVLGGVRKYTDVSGKQKTCDTYFELTQSNKGELSIRINGGHPISLAGKNYVLGNLRQLLISLEGDERFVNSRGEHQGVKTSNRLMDFAKTADYSNGGAPARFKENAMTFIRTRFRTIDQSRVNKLKEEDLREIVAIILNKPEITPEELDPILDKKNGIDNDDNLAYTLNQEDYSALFAQEKQAKDNNQELDAQANEELKNIRKTALAYIVARTRVVQKIFEPLSTKELHEKSVQLCAGKLSTAEFLLSLKTSDKMYDEVMYQNTTYGKYLNDESTLKIMKLRKAHKEDADKKIKFINKKGIKKLHKVNRPVWSDQELAVKNLLSALFFTPNTWDTDLDTEETAKEMGKALSEKEKATIMLGKYSGRLKSILTNEAHAKTIVMILKNPDLLRETTKKIPFLADRPEHVLKDLPMYRPYNRGKTELSYYSTEVPEEFVKSLLYCFNAMAGFVKEENGDKVIDEERIDKSKSDEELVASYVKSVNELDEKASFGAADYMDRTLKGVTQDKMKLIQKILIKQIDERLKYSAAIPPMPGPNAIIEEQNDWVEEMLKIKTLTGDSGQALFLRSVLKDYFANISDMDQNSVMAYMIKEAEPGLVNEDHVQRANRDIALEHELAEVNEAEATCLSGMIKGAGPLLQKMLQGLPEEQMPEIIKNAIKDTRSKLNSIPDEIVQEKLYQIMVETNEKLTKEQKPLITKIEVVRSLGAASIGQAFLVKLYMGDDDTQGLEQVIKILRPDVVNRMQREKVVVEKIAKDAGDAVYKSYDNTYKRIEEELNLGDESANIEKGKKYYDKSLTKEDDHVKAMNVSSIIAPKNDMLALEKAKGNTVDGTIRDYQKQVIAEGKGAVMMKDEVPVINSINDGNIPKDSLLATFDACQNIIDQMLIQQKYLENLTEKWLVSALYTESGKNGFFHGDLHSGNIMLDKDQATIIDFGNASELTSVERTCLIKILAATAAGSNVEKPVVLAFTDMLKSVAGAEIGKEKIEEFVASTKHILELGDGNTVAQRVALLFAEAQNAGIPLSAAVANFVQGQLRLQNTINEFSKNIKAFKKLQGKCKEHIDNGYYNTNGTKMSSIASEWLAKHDPKYEAGYRKNMKLGVAYFALLNLGQMKQSDSILFSKNEKDWEKADRLYNLDIFKDTDSYKELVEYRRSPEVDEAKVKKIYNGLTIATTLRLSVPDPEINNESFFAELNSAQMKTPCKEINQCIERKFLISTIDEAKANRDLILGDASEGLKAALDTVISEREANKIDNVTGQDLERMRSILIPYMEEIEIIFLDEMLTTKRGEVLKLNESKQKIRNYTNIMADTIAKRSWRTANTVGMDWAKTNIVDMIEKLGLSEEELIKFFNEDKDIPYLVKKGIIWTLKSKGVNLE